MSDKLKLFLLEASDGYLARIDIFGKYNGTTRELRSDVFIRKIKNNEEFEIEGNKHFIITDKEKAIKSIQDIVSGKKGSFSFVGKIVETGEEKELSLTKFKKTVEFKGTNRNAGSIKTKAIEEISALFISLVQNVFKREIYAEEVTLDNLKQAYSFINVKSSFNDLSSILDTEYETYVITANLTFNFLKNANKYNIYRGTGIMDIIFKKFLEFNKKMNLHLHYNNWNASDIFLCKQGEESNIKSEIDKIQTLHDLNVLLHNLLANKTLIGISLKKAFGGSSIEINNFDKNKEVSKEISSIELYNPKKKFYDTGYIFVKLKNNEIIELRTKIGGGIGFSGMIRNSNAYAGSISEKPIFNYINETCYKPEELKNFVNTKDKSFFKDFYEKFKAVNNSVFNSTKVFGINTLEDFIRYIYDNIDISNNYYIANFRSKYLGIVTVYNLLKNKKFLDFLLGYIFSQTEFSSAFVKIG